MSEFDRPMPPFRLAQTHRGDDLQAVAARELGDANRWVEIAWLNKLSPPHLTDNETIAGDRILLTGSLIKVPAPTGVATPGASIGQVYERDCFMSNRMLSIENGDIAVVAGSDNLTQQLKHRINTPRGQLRRHPDYGCLIWRLMGKVAGPMLSMLGTEYLKSALLADYRISSVLRASAVVSGDSVRFTAHAMAIGGGGVDIISTTPVPGVNPGGSGSGYGNNYGNDYGR